MVTLCALFDGRWVPIRSVVTGYVQLPVDKRDYRIARVLLRAIQGKLHIRQFRPRDRIVLDDVPAARLAHWLHTDVIVSVADHDAAAIAPVVAQDSGLA